LRFQTKIFSNLKFQIPFFSFHLFPITNIEFILKKKIIHSF
jgi:hypothetical protein